MLSFVQILSKTPSTFQKNKGFFDSALVCSQSQSKNKKKQQQHINNPKYHAWWNFLKRLESQKAMTATDWRRGATFQDGFPARLCSSGGTFGV